MSLPNPDREAARRQFHAALLSLCKDPAREQAAPPSTPPSPDQVSCWAKVVEDAALDALQKAALEGDLEELHYPDLAQDSSQPWATELPNYEKLDPQAAKDLRPHVRVLLVVATCTEYEAVSRLLIPLPGLDDLLLLQPNALRANDPNIYYVGALNDYAVTLVQSRAGSIGRAGSAVVIHDAILTWQPKVVIAIGVAFGNPTYVKHIGDVVVATEVIPYEPQRLSSGSIKYRGEHLQSDLNLVNMFTSSSARTKIFLPSGKPCSILPGPILSGEKLVDSAWERDKLFKEFSNAVAGEMEAAGIAAVCARLGITKWAIVKAVADWAAGKQSGNFDKCQPMAAYFAATVVHEAFQAPALLAHGIEFPKSSFPAGAPANPLNTERLANPHNEIVIKPTDQGVFVREVWTLRPRRSQETTYRVRELFEWLANACVVTGDVPDDDIDSLRRFQAWYFYHFVGAGTTVRQSTIPWTDDVLDGHLCSLGGPVDQELTRFAMGYNYELQYLESRLPFMFPVSSRGTLPLIRRKWRRRGWPERSWYIEDAETRKPLFVPESEPNEPRLLNKDYIVLAVIPNMATAKSRSEPPRKHFLVAACHGLAQLALASILDDDQVLATIQDGIQGASYWQAVIEVPGTPRWGGYEVGSPLAVMRVLPLTETHFSSRKTFHEWRQERFGTR